MNKPPRPVFHHNGITLAVIDHLAEHPDDGLSWAAYADLLEAAEAPAAAILVARQCGLWRGTREEWERDGPEVVDVVPVRWVWVMDMAPTAYSNSTVGFYVSPSRELRLAEYDIQQHWCLGDSDRWVQFPTAEAAQSWLTEIALAYARRVRNGETEEVAR